MLSLGIEASLAFEIASASAGLPSGSPPPSFAATVIARVSFVKSLPRRASTIAFLCLIPAHFECPAIPIESTSPAKKSARPSTAAPPVSAGLSEPLHLRAADDLVLRLAEAHPGLVRAVVVGRPQHERPLAPADAHRVAALGVEPAPDADERVALPLVEDRRRVGVPGMDADRLVEDHHALHDRVLEVAVAGRVR